MVKGNAPWDYKADFVNRSIENVKLGSQYYKMDVVANIHFGFVGAASGFSAEELLVGAGVAQVMGETSSWSYWNSNFDDPGDQVAIWLGIKLYDEYGPELTVDQLITALDQYGSNLNQPKWE